MCELLVGRGSTHATRTRTRARAFIWSFFLCICICFSQWEYKHGSVLFHRLKLMNEVLPFRSDYFLRYLWHRHDLLVRGSRLPVATTKWSLYLNPRPCWMAPYRRGSDRSFDGCHISKPDSSAFRLKPGKEDCSKKRFLTVSIPTASLSLLSANVIIIQCRSVL